MTTLPHTLLSEQEICDAFLEAKAVQPTLAQELRIGRTIESKAIAAYAAKLAQGVELEGFRLTWHSDQARYTVSKPNIDTMDVVPLSTAQAAVAAERAKAHRCKCLLREGCDYLASCRSICNKCGREHTLPIQSSPAPAAEPVPQAVADVLAERRRQVEELGWTAHHDDEHANGELATAAAAYADPAPAMYRDPRIIAPLRFPPGWDYKPKDYRTNLVRAAALLVAEIERVDRGGPIPPHLLIYRERIRMSDARKAEIAREKAEFEADCARIPTPKDKP